MRIGADGSLDGVAPCNAYRGALTASPPRFAVGPLSVTERACLHLDGEDRFFDALIAADTAEIEDGRLVLSGGETLVFAPRPDA